ncbi:helicase [Herbihabitans rhizosphaerae]|uniref:helicase n=1 Tax=Herbihabitans rhizosphaerae TaxID=1872711 RepID=UPI0013EEAEB4|nr:helicase [Herbihabitans rhizosphaerae]
MRAERDYVEALYQRLDAERESTAAELTTAMKAETGGNTEALFQRDVAVNTLRTKQNRLHAADGGLCFGRLAMSDGERVYIGRIGLFDEEDDYRPLLTDWRAPASRAFYTATAARSEGVAFRRHFLTRGRDVLDLSDEPLGGDSISGDSEASTALLNAVNAPRAEAMADIVSTIQADQDEIIRLPHHGVVVLDGGPGTGKTAVALHRVAYLLYTQRERMSRSGVLIVGPNASFLRWIGAVLPSLGETDVVFATPGELFPGLRTTRQDDADAKRIKGSLDVLAVLAAAVADRQELPGEPIPIELDDVTVPLDDELVSTARERARSTGLPHNDARPAFRKHVVEVLVERAVADIGEGWLDEPEDRGGPLWADLAEDVLHELKQSQSLAKAVDQLWPHLTPTEFLHDLLSDETRLRAAFHGRPDADWQAVHRRLGDAWTVSDVPLLDEAVDLLGEGPATARAQRAAEHERRRQAKYAAELMEILGDQGDPDYEQLRVTDVVDAERLADRHGSGDGRVLAERAAADRDWTYGHIVVDEAQELSEMDWRLLMRRCPSKSFTIVGDLAQRESPAGSRAWEPVLSRYVAQRWTFRQLTVNYRTPAEIMDVAAGVLAEIGPGLTPPTSIRSSGTRPSTWHVPVPELAETVAKARAEYTSGTTAVIAPADLGIEGSISPYETKGLEFDSVIVVEPHRILIDGAAQLYVALTRATQRLTIVHSEPLPECLAAAGR